MICHLSLNYRSWAGCLHLIDQSLGAPCQGELGDSMGVDSENKRKPLTCRELNELLARAVNLPFGAPERLSLLKRVKNGAHPELIRSIDGAARRTLDQNRRA